MFQNHNSNYDIEMGSCKQYALTIITYEYNKDSSRTKKVVDGIETTYQLENNHILFERTGRNMIYYIRDENQNLVGFRYNDTTYYYLKNAQEDIIGILDNIFDPIPTNFVTTRKEGFENNQNIATNNYSNIQNKQHIKSGATCKYSKPKMSKNVTKETALFYFLINNFLVFQILLHHILDTFLLSSLLL